MPWPLNKRANRHGGVEDAFFVLLNLEGREHVELFDPDGGGFLQDEVVADVGEDFGSLRVPLCS